MKGLTDIEGVLVGHATHPDALTGCTVMLFEQGAAAGVDVRGSATGSQEMDLLSPLHLTARIHGLVFSGGSAYGLETASGVRRFLEKKGVGFSTGPGLIVPLVPCAILYDLGVAKRGVRPGREMGEAAAAAASGAAVPEGCVGAGAGATVGKLFGLARAMKSGIGSFTVALDGPYATVRVSALAAVNAFGDVRDPVSGRLVAGARAGERSRALADSARHLKAGARAGAIGENTTLVAVATNARLTKVQATKLAQLAQAGLARALSPPWTIYDGDLVVALSTGAATADITALGVAAAEATAQAIIRAVQLAHTTAGIPGLAG